MSERRSFLHRVDPRIKFAVFFPLVLVISVSDRTPAAAAFLLLGALFVLIAETPARFLLKRLLVANLFILLLWFTAPASVALLVTLKVNSIFLFTICVLGTTEVFSLVHALAHLKLPKRLVHLFFFFYRYIHVAEREYEKQSAAVKVRSFSPRSDYHTWRSLAHMAGMLFVRSYERSQRVYQALVLRGFREDFPLIAHFHLRRSDLVFSAAMFLIIGGLLLWK